MTSWLVDAYLRDNRVFFVFFNDESGALEEREIDLLFYGYLLSSNPEKVAYELREVDGIIDAWIEEWRVPPYYESTTRIVVFKTKKYEVLRWVFWASARKGVKPLNTFPHPLVEALFRAGLRPLTRLRKDSRSSVKVEDWNPASRDPPLRYLVLGFENGYFTVRTPRNLEKFKMIEEVADFVRLQNFHVGFADPYVYATLTEADPGVARVAKWVTGGSFSPHEYFEWSRLSYTPLSLMSNITIGKVLTTIEALNARTKKMVVDKHVGRRERWRRLSELLVYDRGGVVYQPRPGFYWWVCQVDFKSLYPSIMVKYNVSGETVDKPICVNRLTLPWTPHNVCIDEEGVVSSSIRDLIELKDLYDELYRKTGDETYLERKNAVKWILVASFGYLGYRNSLFGSVMAHELVTSTSREVLRKAKIAIEERGYRVIHAIVDSIFVEGVKTLEECSALKEAIESATGFRAKVEAHYVWLYVPRSLLCENGVSNRYYGLLSDGSKKVRGVLSVRRDTPLLVKKAQQEALEKLFEARSPGELAGKILEAHAIINKYAEAVRQGSVDLYELILSRHSRVREGYKKPPEHVLKTKPPYRLVYVGGRLVPLEEALERGFDAEKYAEMLEKARRELPSLKDLRLVASY